MSVSIPTIGILGAGRVGVALARQAIQAGYPVVIATSKPAAEIALLVEVMAPGAEAVDTATLVERADIVLLATPLHKYRTLPAALLAGKVVVDAMNRWDAVDDLVTRDVDPALSTSEHVAAFLDRSRVVKTLNHIGYHEVEEDARPSGAADRRALVVAGDDETAVADVAAFIDRLGFDAVTVPSLAAGVLTEPGTRIFVDRFGADELRGLLVDVAAAA